MGKDRTSIVSPGYFFDLDYVRSKIGKQHRCCWTRQHTGEVNDIDAT